MARRRRPSIPLIILFVILLLLYFLAGFLFSLTLDYTGNGTITYSYTAGNDVIVSIRYGLPQDLAEAMDPQPVSGWTVNLAGNVLSLTGGTLTPGQSVTVDYKLTKYIEGGTKQFTATAVTDKEEKTIEKSLEVETTVLGIMWLLYQNAIWFLILAIIVLVVIILLFLKGKKKDEEEQKKE